MSGSGIARAKITLVSKINGAAQNVVEHNGFPTRVVLRRDMISVGCTDVTPEVARYILEQWEKKFGAANEEVVLQP